MNEFTAGLIGGTAGLVVGHPLDTIKAIMQTKSDKGMWLCTKILYQETKVKYFQISGYFYSILLLFFYS
jgi:hypothetical protein